MGRDGGSPYPPGGPGERGERRGEGGVTFAGGGAAVVLEVGAVLALVVLRTGAVVVVGQVEAGRAVLTRVGQAVVYVQLGGGEGEGVSPGDRRDR